MSFKPASKALAGIRVLDLTRVRSGPTCVRQLADWGADVIKIEVPEALEPDGALGAPRHTSDFQNLHRNKRSLTLNLKEADGLEILMKLVETADVMVENFRPDVKHRLGLDYDSLSARNPRIILGSISGFGQTGPYANRPGFDQIAQGMGGLMSITGAPGGGPMRVGIPVADLCAGLFCAMGILTALLERHASGKGQWVQSSLLEAQVFMLDFQAARYVMSGEIPQQAGNNHPTSIPTGVFATSNGHINIAVAGEVIWQRFCKVMGKQSWAQDARFADSPKRSENRDQLNQEIAAVISTNTSDHWVELFSQAGIPAGPIHDMAGVFSDPQVEHLEIAKDISTRAFGDTRMIAQPVQLSRTPSDFTVGPPERGEQTDEILAELGISDDRIDDFRNRNVI